MSDAARELLVMTPNGSINVDRAGERDLAYVCAIHKLPWELEHDEAAMRATVWGWYSDMQAKIAADRAEAEAFYAEMKRHLAARRARNSRGIGNSADGGSTQ